MIQHSALERGDNLTTIMYEYNTDCSNIYGIKKQKHQYFVSPETALVINQKVQ